MDANAEDFDHAGAVANDIELLYDLAQQYGIDVTWMECRETIRGIYSDALRIKRKHQHAARCRGRRNHTKSIPNATRIPVW